MGGREVNLNLDNVFKYTGFFLEYPLKTWKSFEEALGWLPRGIEMEANSALIGVEFELKLCWGNYFFRWLGGEVGGWRKWDEG